MHVQLQVDAKFSNGISQKLTVIYDWSLHKIQ